MLVAAKTGVYAAHDQKQLPKNASIEIDTEDCVQRMKRIQEYERQVREWFSHHSVHEMVYEDLVDHQDIETDQVLKFIGVDTLPLQGRMIRQSKSLRDSVLNFDELVTALNDTEFESLLTSGN